MLGKKYSTPKSDIEIVDTVPHFGHLNFFSRLKTLFLVSNAVLNEDNLFLVKLSKNNIRYT